MADLSKQDLGNGATLSFQRHPVAGVRAIVKDAAGVITHRGPVVDEARAEVSRRAVAGEYLASLRKKADEDLFGDLNALDALDEEDPD